MELRKIETAEPKSNVVVAPLQEDKHRHREIFSVLVGEPGHYMIYPSNKLQRHLPITPHQTLGVFYHGELIVSVTLEMCLFPRFQITKPNTLIYVCIGDSKDDCLDKMSGFLGIECYFAK